MKRTKISILNINLGSGAPVIAFNVPGGTKEIL